MTDAAHRATIVAAVIAAAATVTAAIIANWDKLVGSPPPRTETVANPAPAPAHAVNPAISPAENPAPVISIAGAWRDPNDPSSSYRISQQGNSFQYEGWGMLPQGIRFESSGSGTITGQDVRTAYTTRYQNGWVARGSCTGSVSADGTRTAASCADDVVGSFNISMVRQ